MRAILAATLTNAIVFLPIAFTTFEDPAIRALLRVLVLAILLPLAGSLVVAVGLVPLLARRLAAPAAMARLRELRDRPRAQRRATQAGPSTRAVRRFDHRCPAAPGCLVDRGRGSRAVHHDRRAAVGAGNVSANAPPGETDQVQIPVELVRGGSLERAKSVFEQLEHAALELEGVERVESIVREEGGSMTVHLVDAKLRPKETTAGRVRQVINDEKEKLHGIRMTTLRPPQAGSLSQLFDDEGSKVVVSGPDARQLQLIAEEVRARAATVPDIGEIAVSGASGRDEVRVTPDRRALAAFGLTADQVLPALSVVSREGIRLQTGFTLPDGREIPMTVRRTEGRGADPATTWRACPWRRRPACYRWRPWRTCGASRRHRRSCIGTVAGSSRWSTVWRPAHQRPARPAWRSRTRSARRSRHSTGPLGYVLETPRADDTFSWFRGILIPVLLLLFAVSGGHLRIVDVARARVGGPAA